MVVKDCVSPERVLRGPRRSPTKYPNASIETGVTYESAEENTERVKKEGEDVAKISTIKEYRR